MKSFQFPLEKVLAFRKRQWEAEAAILESLIAKRAHLESERRRVEASMEEAVSQLASAAWVTSERVAEFRLAHASSREAVREITAQLAFLSDRRNYELVARLREKRYAEWLKDVNRQEEADARESYLGRLTQRRLALSSRAPGPARSSAGIPPRSAEPADAH